jgi:hypothetical protein
VLSALCEHTPSALQVSIVQLMPSLQSVSAQQPLQPLAQHFWFAAQVVKLHLPPTHEPVWHALPTQSVLCRHCAVTWQPLIGSHTELLPHCEESAVCPQVPCVHESLVQLTESSQSAALQQEPQVAEVLSGAAQQSSLSAHRAGCWHLPAVHTSLVQGSLSLQLASSQHSAQPVPGQHTPLFGHTVGAWSHNDIAHMSSVHGSLSSQPVASAQASFLRQSLATEQYSPALQLSLFGECVQAPAKQTSSVHWTASSQSA